MTVKKLKSIAIVTPEIIENKIHLLREKKVMLDQDLAYLYAVKTKVFNQAVKRNFERFPDDFMFQLTQEELENLRSQTVTSSWGGQRYLPYAFTEHGILMLSSILNSDKAVAVNIQIMRTFTKLRALLVTHADLRHKIEDMEKKYDYQFKIVFDAIKRLLEAPEKSKEPFGFHPRT